MVLHAPDGYRERLTPLSEGVKLVERLEGAFDFVQVFVRDKTAIDREIAEVLAAVKTDITRDRGWDAVYAAGWRPVAQIALDDTWSALRFRPRTDVGKRWAS